MVTHSKLVDPLYILHENMLFKRSLKHMFLINLVIVFNEIKVSAGREACFGTIKCSIW
jgi:hypothetical protein